MSIKVTLTAYNMGENVTEADYDLRFSYVASQLDYATSLDVDVHKTSFSHGPLKDLVEGCTEDQHTAVREAIDVLWDSWCSEGAL
jgi:hypothetical protein